MDITYMEDNKNENKHDVGIYDSTRFEHVGKTG